MRHCAPAYFNSSGIVASQSNEWRRVFRVSAMKTWPPKPSIIMNWIYSGAPACATRNGHSYYEPIQPWNHDTHHNGNIHHNPTDPRTQEHQQKKCSNYVKTQRATDFSHCLYNWLAGWLVETSSDIEMRECHSVCSGFPYSNYQPAIRDSG